MVITDPEGNRITSGENLSLDTMRMLRRSPRLADIARVAAFLASDQAIGITGTFVNVTGGMFLS